MPGHIKALRGIGTNVPFAGHERAVTRRLEQLRPEHASLPLFVGCVVDAVGIPDAAASNQHGATGHTDRSTPRTHVVGMAKPGATGHQPVEVGGVDVGPASSPDGLVGHIVGEQKQHIRPRTGCGGLGTETPFNPG